MASVRAMGRRHLPWLFYSLAFVGVPVGVIAATGGGDSVAFWIVCLVWLAGVFYGAILVVFLALLVLSPVLLLLGKILPGDTDAAVARVSRVAVAVLGIGAFLMAAPLGDGSGARLPVSWPNLGAVLIIVVATCASFLLWRVGRRVKPAKQPTPRIRRHSVPEPEEEYWSSEYVVGWRSWNWAGSSLRGVYASWPSAVFEASCPDCAVAPSWEHVCGVYAAKSPAGVHVFYGWTPIVGRVEMWGEVIEHENGYRASHARITDLWVPDPIRAERIQAAYPSVNVMLGSPTMAREVA